MPRENELNSASLRALLGGATGLAVLAGVFFLVVFIWFGCRIEVGQGQMAVLVRKTGLDIENGDEIAPTDKHKGVQEGVLRPGRFFYNPWNWSWEVVPQVEVPEGKLGVLVRMFGDELPYGEVVALKDNQKGIVADPLRPGRYAINGGIEGESRRSSDSLAYRVELHEPIVIPAGYRGVVTLLSGPMPKDPNQLLSDPGERGVQKDTLSEGTNYVNPYLERIDLIDCRSQRFNVDESGEMGFPSRDGFWVTLDAVIEFRVKPLESPRVLVLYNESFNDRGRNARVDEEVINKIILPNARSFCRLRGSDHSGKEFISGDTRAKFQDDFQKELKKTCETEGVEIVQALITKINPPQKIAGPVRDRQIALQQERQYQKQLEQQVSEQQLAVEQEMIARKQELVGAEQKVVRMTTEARRAQEVAVIDANRQLTVAQTELEAAQDTADAISSRGKAAAEVIRFQNEAEAAGWRKAVEAFQGQGAEYARYLLLTKLAPSFRQMMVNTADSPIMDIFKQYQDQGKDGSVSPAARLPVTKVPPTKAPAVTANAPDKP